MRFAIPACLTVLLVVGAASLLGAQEPVAAQVLPVEKMRRFIAEGVDSIIAGQQEDGSWRYSNEPVYDVGMTALCTLALRHSTLTRAVVPAQKGLAFVGQHAPEPQTYTAGLVEILLFEAGVRGYEARIGQYAQMVIRSQLDNPLNPNMWGYSLVLPETGGVWPRPGRDTRGDNSNTQYAILALYYAQKSGFQVPLEAWQRVKDLYETTQREDGAWSYLHPLYLRAHPGEDRYTFSMTCVGTISLFLAEETLAGQAHQQCKMNPEDPKVVKGMDWVGKNMPPRAGGYTWYACERLGILTGRSEFAGKDWLDAGVEAILASPRTIDSGIALSNTAFQVVFLSRALEPIRINKLQRAGDWNNDPYDMKHLTEFITEKYQNPTQWRIVTLEAPVEYLLRVPILYLNGHDELKFTDEEKAKLKEYVNRGGTIFGMACCGRKTFDKSFRELVAELWPELQLLPVPKTHPLFEFPKRNLVPPTVLGMALEGGQGRLGVIYSPYDFCCRWHMGGKRAEPTYALGVNLVYYVDIVAWRQGAVRAGYGAVNTAGDQKVENP